MDSMDEDLSARILLKNVLHTELSRSPVTRNTSQAQLQASVPRRSSRIRRREAVGLTPQEALRRSMKQKICESTSRVLLPPSKRRTMSIVVRKVNTPAPAPASLLYEDVTPRHLLRGILQTEPETSQVFQDRSIRGEPVLLSADSSLNSNRPSSGLSGLDLPDVTMVNLGNTVKGLSRKRPRRSLNVTVFEKHLEDGIDKEVGDSAEDLSALSSTSLNSATLSLKTPFVDVRTEKRGLQRKLANRQKINVEEFDAAVQIRQRGGGPELYGGGYGQQSLSETAGLEGFTLGLSDLNEPETIGNTKLYAQPVTTGETLQREGSVSPTSETEEEEMGHCQTEEAAAEPQTGEEGVETQTGKEEHVEPQTGEEEEDVEPQIGEEEDVEPQTGGEEDVEPQTGEEHVEPKTEEEHVESKTGEEEDVEHQTEEEEYVQPKTEEEEHVEPMTRDEPSESQTVEAAESQTEEEGLCDLEDSGQQILEGNDVRSQKLPTNTEHISRRMFRSEGGTKMPVLIEGARGYKSMGGTLHPTDSGSAGQGVIEDPTIESHSGPGATGSDLHSVTLGSVPPTPFPNGNKVDQKGSSGSEDSFCQVEDSLPPLEISAEPVNHTHNSGSAPLKPQSQGEEEEEEEEEHGNHSEELSMKTPAFVRERRNGPTTETQTTPTVFRETQASVSVGASGGVKPKAVRRKQADSTKNSGLPKSYIMSVFKHFAKTKVSADVYPVLKEIMERYFDRLSDDLEMFAAHAKRKTIEVEDVELLLRRQGFVTDSTPVNVLIEKYLPMEYRKLLIPVATSGNHVIPKQRK